MRYILLFGVVYALLVLEAVLLRVVRVDLLAPGLAQAVVVYVALSRRGSAPAHAMFALAIGYLCDVLSGSPRGLHAFVLVALAMLGRLVARRVYIEGFVAEALAALGGSATSAMLIGAVAFVLPEAAPAIPWSPLPAQLIATALVGPPIFAMGRRLDARLGLGAVRTMKIR
ncbi:MAG: rod shape-determining protein MreD [Myxococcota bacterium]